MLERFSILSEGGGLVISHSHSDFGLRPDKCRAPNACGIGLPECSCSDAVCELFDAHGLVVYVMPGRTQNMQSARAPFAAN